MTPWTKGMAARMQEKDAVTSRLDDFFGQAAKPDEPDDEPSKPKRFQRPLEQPPASEPGKKDDSKGQVFGSIAEAVGGVVGGFFGGPAGATAGAAVAGFAADQVSKAGNVPQGPGATISGGTVDVKSPGGDQAGQVADKLQQMAVRGIQTRLAPQGRGKVF